MREAVIVSTARTPIGKAYRGAFNNLEAPTMGAQAIREAVRRARIEPGEIDDVVIGAAMQQGSTGYNLGRACAIASGLPVTVSGMTIDRQCASGLMAIATASKQVVSDGMPIVVGGGLESISLVQNEHRNGFRAADPTVMKLKPELYMAMLDTAEVVAKRYNVSREAQDIYSLESQRRTAAAQESGKFDAEIIAVTCQKAITNKDTGAVTFEEVTLRKDEGNRADTTIEGLRKLKPVRENGSITAGNASQLSDGASACVIMERKVAEQRGATALGIYRGMAVAGCEPD
jgi:acetyl-CoA C-acetyltransferase